MGRMNLKEINIALLIVISGVILFYMGAMSPYRCGDYEYIWMTESFFNHGTPDLREVDVREYVRLKEKFDNPLYQWDSFRSMVYWGHYYPAKNGKFYTHHFWLYSLFCVPFKWLLRLFGQDEFKSFQLSNAIFLIIAFFHVLFLARWSEKQKFFYILLVFSSPVVWFLHFISKEVFQAALIMISLMYLTRRQWACSVLNSALAAASSSQIIFLPIFYWFKGVWDSQKLGKAFLGLSVLLLVAFIPFIFYSNTFDLFHLGYYHEGEVSKISLSRVLSLFFDLNIGMLPYSPVMLALFFFILMHEIFVKRKFTLHLQLFLVLILIMVANTMMCNFNHGTIGPSRHVVWLFPFIFFVVINSSFLTADNNFQRRIFIAFLWVAVISQSIMIHNGRWFDQNPRITDNISFTPLATKVLNSYPQFYNPDYQVFTRRCCQDDINARNTVFVYKHQGQCKKALVMGRDMNALQDHCGYIPEREKDFFLNPKNKYKFKYVNY